MDYLIAVTLFLVLLIAALLFVIRKLQRALTKARRTEHRYRLLWQKIPDVITELDTAGRILSVNRLMDGFSMDGVVGKLGRDLLMPDQVEIFEQNLAHALTTLTPAVYEISLTGDAGQVSWLRNQLVPVQEFGALTGVLVISTDITEPLQAREILRREKVAAQEESLSKSRFLASMSHEIRTPMTGLIGMVSLLEQTELTTEQQGFVRIIQQSSDHLLSIVNDILDSSKIDANMLTIEQEVFSVRELVDGLLSMMAARAREKGLAMQSFVDHHIPAYLLGDAVRIRQILMNYLTNALKFTEQGHVLLRLVLVSSQQSRLRIRFSVEDSGIGISTEQARTIFDEYSTAHGRLSTLAGGTGLGLSICRRLATLMGGRVGVASSVGTGSHFWLDLELAAAVAEDAPDSESEGLQDLAIWVLDELQVNRSLVVSVARHIPTRVREFPEFVQVELALQKSEAPAVLIVAERILHQHEASFRQLADKGVRLAVTSATAAVPDERQLAAVGARAYWDWPVGQEQLRRMLIRLLKDELPPYGVMTRFDTARRKATQSPLAGASGLRVLLAEDNLVNQKVAAQMLRRLGCDVVVSADGRAAVEQCRQHKFDLVLMDCHMPVMDGLEATRAIRELPGCERLPVLALSADVMAEQKAACEAAGMNGYLTKPVRIEDLRTALEPYQAGAQSALP
ncbi:response regulator [Thalassolituus sp. LLYu03]|uniref:response regulator n=1 Tax=Thalassolituus sp. LLYu03 TaxID=3421656 RepID=UPI003D26E8B1